jgi:hypothetical protein
LVRGERDGRRVVYRVEPAGLQPLTDWIRTYQAFWTDRIERLEALLETLDR